MLIREPSTARREIVFGLPVQVLPYVSYPSSPLFQGHYRMVQRLGSLGLWKYLAQAEADIEARSPRLRCRRSSLV